MRRIVARGARREFSLTVACALVLGGCGGFSVGPGVDTSDSDVGGTDTDGDGGGGGGGGTDSGGGGGGGTDSGGTDTGGGGGSNTGTGGALILSEVGDDGAGLGWVELFNASTGPINLASGPRGNAYRLSVSPNGNAASIENIELSGTIASGETFVVTNNAGAFQSKFGVASQLENAAIVLTGGDDGYIIGEGSRFDDSYGYGTQADWNYAGTAAVRKSGITTGQRNMVINEWTIGATPSPGVR